MSIKHWINGRQVDSKDRFVTYNPATGEAIAEVAAGGQVEIDAGRGRRRGFSRANTPAERARLMRRLGELIDQNVPMLAELETRDTGLPISQTRKQLIPRASENFNFFAEVCTRMNGHTYPVDDQMLNYTLYQPVGVCALVSPWNVPFMTATWKTAPCLALGNTAVLKMSELSPLTADQLGMLALEAGIPPGVLNVVQGYGADAGDALVRHPGVRAISFGGTVTGKKILASAGGVKKYSMELGGKSPCWCSTTPTSSARWTRRCSPSSRSTASAALRLAHLRAGNHLRRFRAPLRRAREPAGGGRPDRRAYPCRFDDHAPALGKGHWLHPSGRGRGRPRAGGRSELPAGLPARLAGGNRASHGAGRRGQPHALRPGRDLRPGRLPAALQGRGRRPDAGQR